MLVHTKRQEVLSMTNAEAVKKYHKESLRDFRVRPVKAVGERIDKYADEHGCSVQSLFLAAVEEYMAAGKVPAEVKKGRKKKENKE